MDFDAEPAAWRRFSGTSGETVVLKPDAYARLGVGELEHSAFVEVDLGTESPSTIARKCGVCSDYWRPGLEQQHHGVFPRVLWLTRDVWRRDRLAQVVRTLAAEMRPLFTVALLAQAVTALTTAAGGKVA